MLRGLEGWHLVILIVVALVLFGGKRLPDAARGLGRSLRIFKAEVNQMKEEDRTAGASATTGTAHSAPVTPEPLEGTVVKDAEPTRTPRSDQA